jgi:predicted ATPase
MFSLALALAYAALVHQVRRDTDRVLECSEEVVTLCERYGFGYYGDWARILVGWARGQVQPAEGVGLIESAIAGLDRQRARARRPYYLSLLAETHGRLGNRERAAAIVDEAIRISLEGGEVWWLPTLYLQKSGLDPADREQSLRRGLDVARAQNSRSQEQRILASAQSAPSSR